MSIFQTLSHLRGRIHIWVGALLAFTTTSLAQTTVTSTVYAGSQQTVVGGLASVSTSGSVVVSSGANVAFTATSSVTLTPGFEVSSGATFSADLNPGSYGDIFAPTVPNSLDALSIALGSFNLVWAASTDDVGVVSYEVMRDATLLGPTANTSFAITGLSQGTSYIMKVRAKDAAGNWSAWSSSINVVTLDSDTDGDLIPHSAEVLLGTNPGTANSSGDTQIELKIIRPAAP